MTEPLTPAEQDLIEKIAHECVILSAQRYYTWERALYDANKILTLIKEAQQGMLKGDASGVWRKVILKEVS